MGQWAKGYTEPLTPQERFKKDDDGLKVKQRILDVYSVQGFSSIDPTDLRGRMRWYGLYTQRRPGIPGGKTAVLEPEELDDEFFMLRVRVEGGRLTTAQLRTIGEISETYGRDVADVTDRQNVQLHWIRIEDVPAIWERLEDVGLSTTEACGDTPRTVLGCPLAGVAADEVLDATPSIEAVAERYIGDPAFSNLPRKYKSSISGCAKHCTLHEINDIGLVGVVHPELGAGFDLWVGVTSVFRDWGYRRSRNRARLKFLLADEGPVWFRETLERDYLSSPLPDGPAAEPVRARRDHVGVTPQHDGRNAVGAVLRVGRTSGTQLQRVADLAEAHGSGRVYATPQQNLVVLDVPAEQTDALVGGLEAEGLEVHPKGLRRAAMACTGIEFCKLALVETKHRADAIVDELERRLPDLDEPVAVQVNGCPNSCARFQTADVGLKGSMVPGPDGELVEGFQIHLGGQVAGEETVFGRKARGLKVTADEATDWLERVLRRWQESRDGAEPFAEWARRVDEDLLR